MSENQYIVLMWLYIVLAMVCLFFQYTEGVFAALILSQVSSLQAKVREIEGGGDE